MEIDMRKFFGATALALTTTIAPAFAQGDRPEINVGLNSVPNNLCVVCNSTFQKRIVHNIFDPLIGRDYGADGQGTAPVPALATAWELVSPTELVVTLREGVTFHNGAPLTAEDVVFSLSEEKLWGQDALTPDSLARGVFKSVEALDDLTVKITTQFPDPAIIARLQSQIARIVPKADFLAKGVDGFRQSPVGTGPFKLSSYTGGDHAELVANDAYWGGEPNAAKVTFREIPESATRVAGLISGELDLIVGVLPQQMPALETRGLVTQVQPQENIQMFAFMSGPEELPVHDPRIRQAMVAAVDLEAISSALFEGTVVPVDGLQTPSYGADYMLNSTSSYDPEKAKALVEEAGYEGAPIKLQMISNSFVLLNETATVLQEQWRDVGLKVQLDIIPDYTLFKLRPPTDVSMWATSNNISMPDPYNPVCTTFTSNSFYGSGGRIDASPELDELCQAFAQETDLEKRQGIWEAISADWAENPQAVTLWQRPEFYAYSADLNWQPTSDFGIEFGPSRLQK